MAPRAPAKPTSSRPWPTRPSTPACAWFTLEPLTAAIARAGVDGSVAKTIARITRAEHIVVDDIGMLPSGQAAAEASYRLLHHAHVIITEGTSPRLAEATAGRRVVPCTADHKEIS